MKKFFKEKKKVKAESEGDFVFTSTDAKQEKEALDRAGGPKTEKVIKGIVLMTSLVALFASLGGCEKDNNEAKEADEDGETDGAGTNYEFVYNLEGVQDYEGPEEATPEEAISAAEAEARAAAEAAPEYTAAERLAYREEYFNSEKASDMEKGIQINSDAVFELRMAYADVKPGEDRDSTIPMKMYEVADKGNIRDVTTVLRNLTEYNQDDAGNMQRTPIEQHSAEWQEMKDIVMETIEKPIPEGKLSDAQKTKLAENIKEIIGISDGLQWWDDIDAAKHENLVEKAEALGDPSISVDVLKHLSHADYNNWANGGYDDDGGFDYWDHSSEFQKMYNELGNQAEEAGGERVMVREAMEPGEAQAEFVKFLAENKDNVNEDIEDIEDNPWTVERLEADKILDMKERAEERAADIEAGKSGVSDDMHRFEVEFWDDLYKSEIANAGGDEYESQREAIKLKMHKAAKDGENLEDTLHAYFRLHTKVMGGNFEKSWQTSADLRDQSPEWHEINDLIMAEVNEPIPGGKLTVEQKADLVEHIKVLEQIEARTRGVRYDEDIKTGIYEKVRDAAVKTEMVELQLIARPHMDSYELTHAKDHRGGALANSEHSAEWREIKESLKEKLNSVDGAEYIWSAGPARDELVKLMNDNGVE